MPSYMKHLGTNYPDLAYLSKIVAGLIECHPGVPTSNIMDYVNSWPGICGKLTQDVLCSVKQSAQSSFIKISSHHNTASVFSDDLQHSLLKKREASNKTNTVPTSSLNTSSQVTWVKGMR